MPNSKPVVAKPTDIVQDMETKAYYQVLGDAQGAANAGKLEVVRVASFAPDDDRHPEGIQHLQFDPKRYQVVETALQDKAVQHGASGELGNVVAVAVNSKNELQYVVQAVDGGEFTAPVTDSPLFKNAKSVEAAERNRDEVSRVADNAAQGLVPDDMPLPNQYGEDD